MTYTRITRPAKEFPFLKVLDYRKRDVSVIATESVTICGLNWSEGSRSSYTAFNIGSGQESGNLHKYHQKAPWDNPAEGAEVSIPPGKIIVRTGYSCGKASQATIYVHPTDMPHLLPAS